MIFYELLQRHSINWLSTKIFRLSSETNCHLLKWSFLLIRCLAQSFLVEHSSRVFDNGQSEHMGHEPCFSADLLCLLSLCSPDRWPVGEQKVWPVSILILNQGSERRVTMILSWCDTKYSTRSGICLKTHFAILTHCVRNWVEDFFKYLCFMSSPPSRDNNRAGTLNSPSSARET